jgi:hypothetical protein
VNSTELDEGETPSSGLTKNGETLDLAQVGKSMVVYGKELTGWSTTNDSSGIVNEIVINSDLTLYAIWDDKTTYEEGDRGPTGGWIFKVDAGTYYEAAKQDLKLQISTDPDKFRTEHTWTYLDSAYSSVDPATDWTVPETDLLKDMYSQLFQKDLGNFESDKYWAIDDDPEYIVDFQDDGDFKFYPEGNYCFARLYRTFEL